MIFLNITGYILANDLSLGATAWANNCNRCHNFRDPSEFKDVNWETVMLHMRVKANLTGKETRNIINFLKISNNVKVNAGIKIKNELSINKGGKDIYIQTCLPCHGPDGKGALPGVPNLNDKNGRLNKNYEELMFNVLNGFKSPGSIMAMPQKGGNNNLTKNDINLVLLYMKENFLKK